MSKHSKKGPLPGPWTKLGDGEPAIAALEATAWLRAADVASAGSDSLGAAVQSALSLRGSSELQRWWTTTDLQLQETA